MGAHPARGDGRRRRGSLRGRPVPALGPSWQAADWVGKPWARSPPGNVSRFPLAALEIRAPREHSEGLLRAAGLASYQLQKLGGGMK